MDISFAYTGKKNYSIVVCVDSLHREFRGKVGVPTCCEARPFNLYWITGHNACTFQVRTFMNHLCSTLPTPSTDSALVRVLTPFCAPNDRKFHCKY